jgi:3-deoxy-D-manno-octulosonic-acid transferase
MRFLYNCFFILFFILSAPFYFVKMWRRGNWTRGFGERFALYSNRTKQALTNRHTLWLHAVSVGEVNVCTQLIHELEPRAPNLKVVVSTTTSTGMELLQKRLPSHVEKIYYPIDRRKYVTRALASIRPEAVVLVEAEIWPNFLWRAFDRQTPVFLVNARLSEKSYRGYKRFGFLFRGIFARFSGVGCQDESDAARLRELGFLPEVIRVVGNLKYDAAEIVEKCPLDIPAMLAQIGVGQDVELLVGGSTHPGEEAVLAGIYQRLRQSHPKLFLVIVPRHFERSKEAGRDIAAQGLKVVYRNEITIQSAMKAGETGCLVVNTTGELRFFYRHASVIFIGKSLTVPGGQNPIEAGALGKAMVFGPNMQNFEAIAAAFVRAGGALQAANARELETAVGLLMDSPEKRGELGRRALQVVRENQGAMGRTVEMILDHLQGSDE